MLRVGLGVVKWMVQGVRYTDGFITRLLLPRVPSSFEVEYSSEVGSVPYVG